MAITIGILAYQGGISEHEYLVKKACSELGIECRTRWVTKKEHLEGIDAIILPGGESTTIAKLASRFGVLEELRDRIAKGLPAFGTCAGAILMAKEVVDRKTKKVLENPLGVMDISIVRNYYGRQRQSFEIHLEIPAIGPKPFRAIFIRAPAITRVGEGVEALARLDGVVVVARQGRMLATTFHPELTEDTRIHRFFIERVAKLV